MMMLKQSDFLHAVVSIETNERQGVMSICLGGG